MFFEGCTHIGESGFTHDPKRTKVDFDCLSRGVASIGPMRARSFRRSGWIGHRNHGAHREVGELERARKSMIEGSVRQRMFRWSEPSLWFERIADELETM
mgnify:CR=1 FL=1